MDCGYGHCVIGRSGEPAVPRGTTLATGCRNLPAVLADSRGLRRVIETIAKRSESPVRVRESDPVRPQVTAGRPTRLPLREAPMPTCRK